jgi:hypothetical protein
MDYTSFAMAMETTEIKVKGWPEKGTEETEWGMDSPHLGVRDNRLHAAEHYSRDP